MLCVDRAGHYKRLAGWFGRAAADSVVLPTAGQFVKHVRLDRQLVGQTHKADFDFNGCFPAYLDLVVELFFQNWNSLDHAGRQAGEHRIVQVVLPRNVLAELVLVERVEPRLGVLLAWT